MMARVPLVHIVQSIVVALDYDVWAYLDFVEIAVSYYNTYFQYLLFGNVQPRHFHVNPNNWSVCN